MARRVHTEVCGFDLQVFHFMKTTKLATLGVLFVAFIWGIEFVLIQNAIDVLRPHSFNFIRFGVASLSIGFCVCYKQKKRLLTPFIVKHGCLLGCVMYLGFTFQTFGLLHTTVSNCAFITSLCVVLVPIFAFFILGEHLALKRIVGVLLAAVGLYLLTATGSVPFSLGDFLSLIGAAMFGLHIVLTGKYSPRHEVMNLTLVQLSTVSLLSFGSALLTEDWRMVVDIQMIGNASVLLGVFVAAILGTSIAILVQTYAQNHISSTRVALIFSLEPFFASITAYFVLNEQLSAAAGIGTVLILTGIILSEIEITKNRGMVSYAGK